MKHQKQSNKSTKVFDCKKDAVEGLKEFPKGMILVNVKKMGYEYYEIVTGQEYEHDKETINSFTFIKSKNK